MTTVGEALTLIQAKLHDSGAIWTRAELLKWWNLGYRQLLAQSQAVKRLTLLEVPPRYAASYMYQWEKAEIGGPTQRWTVSHEQDRSQATTHWEVEAQAGVTPTNSLEGITQPWERAEADEVQQQYRFALPKNHDRIAWVAYDHRRLLPISVRELDFAQDDWMRVDGEMVYWTLGIGPVKTFEIYQIISAYHQAYDLVGTEDGLPRQWSGSRTYATQQDTPIENAYAYTTESWGDFVMGTGREGALRGLGWRFTQDYGDSNQYHGTYLWEKEMDEGATTLTDSAGPTDMYTWEREFHAAGTVTAAEFAVGTLRGAVSPDRQYLMLPQSGDSGYGAMRGPMSSDDAVMVLEVVVPERDLEEGDTPDLIPAPLEKYLRYYVWSRAFGRLGEGYQPDASLHYEHRFARGVALFTRLSAVTERDRAFVRESVGMKDRRPPLVRLPPEFERVW